MRSAETSHLRSAVEALWSGRNTPAHNANHALRVAALARRIAFAEGCDLDEAEAAGLVHDVGRLEQEEEAGHAQVGVPRAASLLKEHTAFTGEAVDRVLFAVARHATANVEDRLTQTMQDADMLDALGAVGLMRAYVSKSHLPEYAEAVIAESWSRNARTISEQMAFQTAFFNWLHTDTAREIAAPRLVFMRAFMAQLKNEVEETTGGSLA